MAGAGQLGRPPVTSAAYLEHVALELFVVHGFEATSVDDIATAAGVGRRTFFRYYASKNDVVWGDFAARLDTLRTDLHAAPADAEVWATLTAAVARFNAIPASVVAHHRLRLSLIRNVPALQAHSTLRYAEWRQVVAAFAAERLGEPLSELRPQLVGHLALGAALAAYEQWLRAEPGGRSSRAAARDAARLGLLLEQAFAAARPDGPLTRHPGRGPEADRVRETAAGRVKPG